MFKADGLPWPRRKRAEISRAFTRGFNVLLWRDGELGYALVSSEDERTLIRFAEKLGAPA